VSSIVDLVKITDASGMGAYKVAYIDTDATAATQTEGGAYNASEPTFGFVEIHPQTEAVLSYISKQTQKQTPLNYQQKVNDSALVALRKRAAKIITDKLVASTLNTAVSLSALDEKTLRTVAFNYGGDESIVGAATLFINKTDLVALGDVRGSDKKAVYEITPDAGNPNTGVIRDGGLAVPYCIDSNLTAGTLVYGQAKGFELALFSNYEIRVSQDFAFDKGLLATRGDVELGGDVIVKGGFVVAKRA
jgi:HK97 family phage major capsid protein